MANSSLLQGNFIKIKKEIKVNAKIQKCVDGLGEKKYDFYPIVFIHDCQFISLT